MPQRLLGRASGRSTRLQNDTGQTTAAAQRDATEHFRQYDGHDGEVRQQPGTAGRRANRSAAGGEEEDGSAAAGNAAASGGGATEEGQQSGGGEFRYGDEEKMCSFQR